MSEGKQRTIRMYDGKVFGRKVSPYGLQKGYLDYDTLAEIVGNRIRCSNLMEVTGYENWDLVQGDYDREVFQYYIITDAGYDMLDHLADDEIVYYNEELDLFLWGITHFGTSWDYVLTDIKIREGWK